MDRDALTREAEKLMPELAAVAAQPARWRSLPLDELERLLLRQCVLYDLFPEDPRRTEDLTQLYVLCTERLPIEVRGRVLDAVAERIARMEHTPNGLLPFIYRDPEPSIVAAATLHSAVLFPLEEGDVLTGPRLMRRIAAETHDDALRGGIFAGLLLLGDRRIVALVDGCWTEVGRDGADVVASARSGIVHAAHVEFLLAALEALPEAEWPRWTAALVQLRATARSSAVVEVERKLPVWAPDPGPPVRMVRQWPIDEYAALVAPRLLALTQREQRQPSLVRAVLDAWGVAPA